MNNTEWIKVTDRLPEYTTHAGSSMFVMVLVCINGYVTEGMYEDGQWRVFNAIKTNKVTHWMPLPEPPPKEEEGEVMT